jgi:hypothetical protein
MLRNQKPQEITEVPDPSQSDGQLRRAEASPDVRETTGQHDLPSMDHGVSETYQLLWGWFSFLALKQIPLSKL